MTNDKEYYGFIYLTTNKVNGMKYVGQKTYDKRGNWKTYLGSGVYLKRAISKYGKDNFSRQILEECESKEILDDREMYWIQYFDAVNSKNYYNIASGGDGGNTLLGFTEEQLREHSRKQSLSKKGIINQGEYNPMAKKVICLNNMKIFNTTVDAANYANTSDSMIQQCCSEKSMLKTAGNDPITNERLQWEYYVPNKIYDFVPYKKDMANITRKVFCKELNITFDSLKAGADYIGKTSHTLWCHLNGYAKSCGKSNNGEKLHWEYV